jgi:hypothetical protein
MEMAAISMTFDSSYANEITNNGTMIDSQQSGVT